MSTKTSIKRVALVAVAALTLGGISAASSFAATYPGLNVSTGSGATSVSAWATNPADSTTVGATVGTYVVESVTANIADSVYTITSTGVGSISIANPSAGNFPALDTTTGGTVQYSVSGNTVQWYTGNAPGIGGNFASSSRTITFAVYSATAGTQTITVAGNSSAAVVQTITWGAAPAISVANSKSVIAELLPNGTASNDQSTIVGYLGLADSTTASLNTANYGVALIGVQLNNNASTPAPIKGDSLTAVVSGNAYVQGTNGPASANYTGAWSVASSSTTDTSGYAVWRVSSNGASGTATITISYTDANGVQTVIATKSIVFYSSTVAKLKATVNYSYIPLAAVTGYTYAGGSDVSNALKNSGAFSSGLVSPAVSVSALDANGNPIATSAGVASNITVTSSNTAVATVAANPTYDTTLKAYYPVITPVAEGSTTLTFADAATGLVTATAVVNVSKAVISSIVTALDNTAYDPATAVKYTITAKDAAGVPVADGTYTGFYVSGDEPVSNVALQGGTSITTDTLTTVSGVESASFYAPVTPGTTVTITGGTLPGTAGSATAGASFIVAALNASTQGGASFTVNGGSDASGATDAANAATDAANAAADAADNATQAASEALAAVNSLATTVASLIAGIKAQITSLTNLITKIKNKVGA